VGGFGHSITHHRFRFVVRQGVAKRTPKGFRWFTEGEIHEIPLSTTAKKALRCLMKLDD
jgi:hypothetical protein